MFVALLIYCNLELNTCTPIAHKVIFKEENFCYQTLAEGIKYYEDRGDVVPVYMCIKLGKENGEAT